MLSATGGSSLILIIATSAAVLDRVESLSWTVMPTIPSIPSIRSFFWSNPLPLDDGTEIARQYAAESQNNIAQTQNNIAQVQSTVKDHVKKIQDNISNQVSDGRGRVFDYSSSPGTKRTVSVTNDGVTEEVITNYESPDGSRRGFAKTSFTTFGNNNNWS